MSEIEALRLKFRNANLDDIFYTLELNQALLKAANLFLDTKGWDNLNKPALERLVLATGEYAALAEYLTALCVYSDFYNANADLNFPVSAFTVFTKFTKAGFTAEEFVNLYTNEPLFTQLNTYLERNSNSIEAWKNVNEINSEYEAENNPLDPTFAQDAQLHLKLLEESPEFVELANSLNAFSGIGGSGNSPMKNILLDLMVEGAQEWAENFLGINDLSALRDLLERATENAGRIAFKATRIIARFIAKKNPLFTAFTSTMKARDVYNKINKFHKVFDQLSKFNDVILEKLYVTLKRTGTGKLLDRIKDTKSPYSSLTGHWDIDMGNTNVEDFIRSFANAFGKQWRSGPHPNSSGGILARHLDVSDILPGVKYLEFYPFSGSTSWASIDIVLFNGKQFKFRLGRL